jgi:hypothetical protein
MAPGLFLKAEVCKQHDRKGKMKVVVIAYGGLAQKTFLTYMRSNLQKHKLKIT